MTWRHTIVIHPEADEFPLLDAAELKALADDIKDNGLRTRSLWRSRAPRQS